MDFLAEQVGETWLDTEDVQESRRLHLVSLATSDNWAVALSGKKTRHMWKERVATPF
jgi:hypothetical protein